MTVVRVWTRCVDCGQVAASRGDVCERCRAQFDAEFDPIRHEPVRRRAGWVARWLRRAS